MALPDSKQTLADWILRRLGAPVTNVEITDVQLEDAIDEAVQFFQEYHYDGAERTYRVIKITDSVLSGNDRMPESVVPDVYDPRKEGEYQPGDRVALTNSNGSYDIYIKTDSEQRNYQTIWYFDSEGIYFINDSDMRGDTQEHDSERFTDSDTSSYIVEYDSEIHTITVFNPDSDGKRVFSIADSDYILYDSERDIEYHYTLATELDSDGYVSAAANYIDSDGTGDSESFVFYDSDKHSTIFYVLPDSEQIGYYVDSDNRSFYYDSESGIYRIIGDSDSSPVFVEYDSEIHFTLSYEVVTYRSGIDSETGSAAGIFAAARYVDSDGTGYVPYDSDKHVIVTYDSDIKISIRPALYDKVTVPYTRYIVKTKQPKRYFRWAQQPLKYAKYKNTLGRRVTLDSDWIYFDNHTWDDVWTLESKELNTIKQVTDYDYTKVGQVGIPIPDNIIGVNKVFRIDNFSGYGMWNYEYQYFLNNFDFFYGNGGASTMPLTNYYITKQNIDLIDNMMNVQPAIRFSKHRNRLYIDTNWKRLSNMASGKDYYLMMECYEINDPEIFTDVYKDKWLKRYATALAKMQWGSNLKKYSNTSLPGGLMMNGQGLYDEGKVEADELFEELKNSQLECDFIIG